jgi:hypothetical protein
MSKEVLDKLLAKFPQAVVSHHARGADQTARFERER